MNGKWSTYTLEVSLVAPLESHLIMLYNAAGNEMCQSCNSELANLTTPEVYAREVENAIQRIQKSIPKVFVNLSERQKISLKSYSW